MRLIVVGALAALGGCGDIVSSTDAGRDDASSSDGGPVDSSIDADPFSSATAVSELNSVAVESSPTLTEDQLLVYFISNRPGGEGSSDIYYSTRASITAPWSAPTLDAVLSTQYGESAVSISRDGLEVYVTSDATETPLIYTARRTSRAQAWPALALAPGLPTSPFDAYVGGSLTADSLRIYFSVDMGSGRHRVYSATRPTLTAAWTNVTAISELDGPGTEGERLPFINGANTRLLYSTARPGGTTGYDVWITTRATPTASWGAAEPFAAINTDANEITPWMSNDGNTIYFVRASGQNTADIYLGTR